MADIPTPDEARDWLKISGQMPDISITWSADSASGSAERHLKLLNLLFGETESAILPPHG